MVSRQVMRKMLFSEDFVQEIALRFSELVDPATERWLWQQPNCLTILRASDRQRTQWLFTSNSPVIIHLRNAMNFSNHQTALKMLGEELGAWVQAWLLSMMVSWAKIRFAN